MINLTIRILTLFFLSCAVIHAKVKSYGYPISDPYVATVVGTPSKLRAPLPDKINIKSLELTVFPDRKTPEILWYTRHLQYSLVYQTHKAPLVFAISGTGSSAHAPSMKILQKALFQAGFHVISLPSPTHPNFVASASTTSVPGYIIDDSKD